MANIENPVPRAAAESIAEMVRADRSVVDAILANPIAALRDLGISDDLAWSLAGVLASELGNDVAPFRQARPVESIRRCANCTVACVLTRLR